MQHIVPQFHRSRSRTAGERPSLNLQYHTPNPLAREFDFHESERIFSEASVTTICGNGRDIAIDGVPGIGSLCNPRSICIYAPEKPPYSPTDTFHVLIAESTGLRIASRSILLTLRTMTSKGTSSSSFSIAGVVQIPLGVVFTDDTHHKIKLLRILPSEKTSDPYESLMDKTFYTEQTKTKRGTDGAQSLITLSGSVAGHADGLITKALFNRPTSLASACSGRIVLICDTGNNCIRCLDVQNHFVTTLVGTPGKSNTDYMTKRQSNPLDPFVRENIPIDKVRLKRPMGICVSSTKPGVVYITDTGNHTVKKIDTINQLVQNIAGLEGQAGAAIGYESMLNTPIGICELPDRTLLVSDKLGLHRVCPDRCFLWQVSSTRKSQGWRDGPLNKALFSSPNGLAFDGEHVFVCDIGNQNVRMITFGASTALDGASALNAALIEHQDPVDEKGNKGGDRAAFGLLDEHQRIPADRTDAYGKHINYQNGARTYDDNDTVEIPGNNGSYTRERAIHSAVRFTTTGSIRHSKQPKKNITPDLGYSECIPREQPQRQKQQDSSDSMEMIERIVVNPMENVPKKSHTSPRTLDARAQSLQSRTGYNFRTIRRADTVDVDTFESRTVELAEAQQANCDIFNIAKVDARKEIHRDADAFLKEIALETKSHVVKSIGKVKCDKSDTILAEQTALIRSKQPTNHTEINVSGIRLNHAHDTTMEPYGDSRAEAEEEYNLYRSLSSEKSVANKSSHEPSIISKSADTPMVILGHTPKRPNKNVAENTVDPTVGSFVLKRSQITNSRTQRATNSDQDKVYSDEESDERFDDSLSGQRCSKLRAELRMSSPANYHYPPANINDMLANKYQEKYRGLVNALIRFSHNHIQTILSHIPQRADSERKLSISDYYGLLISRCISVRLLLLTAKIVDGNQLCTVGFNSLGHQAISLSEFREYKGYSEAKRHRKTPENASLSMNSTVFFAIYGDFAELRIKNMKICGVKMKASTNMDKFSACLLSHSPSLADETVWQSSVLLSQVIENADIDEDREHMVLICPVEITFIYQQIQSTATVNLLLTNDKLTLRHTADDCMSQLHVYLRTQALYPVPI